MNFERSAILHARNFIRPFIISLFFCNFYYKSSDECIWNELGLDSFLPFLFALPILFLIVLFRKNLRELWEELKKHPLAWIGWGSVAGIGFYSLLSFAAVFSPAWLVAGTWQVTILAGLLLSPLFFVKNRNKNQVRNLYAEKFHFVVYMSPYLFYLV